MGTEANRTFLEDDGGGCCVHVRVGDCLEAKDVSLVIGGCCRDENDAREEQDDEKDESLWTLLKL